MTANISQLNISRGGIPKRCVDPAMLTPLGLEGDACAHPKIHGGPEQAILLIGEEVIDELKGMGYELYAGALGENVTTRGLAYSELRSGMRLRLGSVCEVELTRLREPCRQLDIYNDADRGKIQNVLKLKGRGGWYARVLRAGPLFAGDPILLQGQVV